ncbi:hypothetical protein D3C72_387510 [compost metagenome]
MKFSYKLFIWVICSLLFLVMLFGHIFSRKVLLVAQENIVVESYPVPDSTRFASAGKIKSGEKVQVLSCDDLKSYSAIHVRLESGQEGYVIKGKYTLELFPVWSSINSPVSYSCPPAWH